VAKKKFKLKDRRPSKNTMDYVHEGLVKYSQNNEFKKLALLVLAHKSDDNDIQNLRKAFDQFDSENDGVITKKEFKKALSNYNHSDEELEEIFDGLDDDEDGTIYYSEFIAATLETRGRIKENRLAEAFDRIDSDDSGYISKKDLMSLLGNDYTEERANLIIDQADVNNDGKISFNEFLNAFRNEGDNELKDAMQSLPHDG